MTGACGCGAVRGERAVRVRVVLSLHALPAQHGTAASAQGRAAPGAFRLVLGEEHLRAWAPDGGFEKVFCGLCGSGLFSRPNADEPTTGVRLGTLDGDPGIRPQWHQFVAYAASWEQLPDDGLPRHDEARPRSGESDAERDGQQLGWDPVPAVELGIEQEANGNDGARGGDAARDGAARSQDDRGRCADGQAPWARRRLQGNSPSTRSDTGVPSATVQRYSAIRNSPASTTGGTTRPRRRRNSPWLAARRAAGARAEREAEETPGLDACGRADENRGAPGAAAARVEGCVQPEEGNEELGGVAARVGEVGQLEQECAVVPIAAIRGRCGCPATIRHSVTATSAAPPATMSHASALGCAASAARIAASQSGPTCGLGSA